MSRYGNVLPLQVKCYTHSKIRKRDDKITQRNCRIFRSPKLILDELGMTPKNFDFDIGMIVAQMVVFKGLAFLLLQRRLKKS